MIMKPVFVIFFLFTYLFSLSQEYVSSFTKSQFEFILTKPVTTKIYLKDGNIIKAGITKVTDSLVFYTVTGNANNSMGFETIPVHAIAKMKIKRSALENGLLKGVVVGGLIGYGAGYISYSDDAIASVEDNDESRGGQAIIGAIIGVIPGAIIGGIIGGVFTKRGLKIKGDPENIKKLVNITKRNNF